MNNSTKIALIGSGSWATAIAKILHTSLDSLVWYIREPEIIEGIRKHKSNPLYVSDIKFASEKLIITNDVNEAISQADILIFCVPSKFIISLCDTITEPLKNKHIVTAIKGIEPESNKIISTYLEDRFSIPKEQVAVISGPCHAEEVALERLSYLTIGSPNYDFAAHIAEIMNVWFIKTCVSNDIVGIEYSAVLKNIMALATGISHGLGYGDNFTSVLISNAIQEMKRFLDTVEPTNRDINDSVYLGDLLVTAYSQFSRNRTFGMMIGKGYTVKSAELEMNMIAEGYYGVNCIHTINEQYLVDMPITQAVYHILYDRISPSMEFKILAESFK